MRDEAATIAWHLDRIRAQSDRIEELEEEVRQLREQLAPQIYWAPDLGLTNLDKRVLEALLGRSPTPLTRERIMVAAYPDPDRAPDAKIVDTVICRMRKRLALHGVRIGTGGYNCGWFIDKENAAILAKLQVSGASPP
jgi:DNA-binding response OmpR family regulator